MFFVSTLPQPPGKINIVIYRRNDELKLSLHTVFLLNRWYYTKSGPGLWRELMRVAEILWLFYKKKLKQKLS